MFATSMSTGVWMFNLAFAKSKDIQFEISDCPVERTSTYEKSGPCPEMGTETKVDKSSDNNMVKPQIPIDKSSDNSIAGSEIGPKSEVNNLNFDELHITGSDNGVNNNDTRPIHSALPSSPEPIDPFGPTTK